MYQKILKQITEKSYFSNHEKVLVAVSGGIDSMNLLQCLYFYRVELGITLGIVHVNHKQRKESDSEEAYLKEWAKKHQVACYTTHFSGKFSENAAREFRYQFFRQTMENYGYTAVVTAHHFDDQAETIFMRLVRGSRLRHIIPIKEVSPFGSGELIRPLLTIKKSELPNIFYFEDSSNLSDNYFRNRVRRIYLPQLQNENPRFKEAIVTLGQENETLLQAFRDLTQTMDSTETSVFLSQTEAVQQFLFQNYLDQFPQLAISKRQFDQMLSLLQGKKAFSYPIKNGYVLQKTPQHFEIIKIQPKTDDFVPPKLLKCGEIVHYGDYQFSRKEGLLDSTIPLYSDKPILLRRRQSGDRIDFGTFTKKIRRLFIDNKISPIDREQAIIGEQNSQVIFVLVADRTYLRKPSKHDIMVGELYIKKD